MGDVYADITLTNSCDTTNAQRGVISKKDIRTLKTNALVDTGASTLIINDDVCEKLGLQIESMHTSTLANGQKAPCKVTEPVRIIWHDRESVCRAYVLPGLEDILLGAIPLEDMDLIIDPRQGVLTGKHGDIAMIRV